MVLTSLLVRVYVYMHVCILPAAYTHTHIHTYMHTGARRAGYRRKAESKVYNKKGRRLEGQGLFDHDGVDVIRRE
jgi:hypothetical protein